MQAVLPGKPQSKLQAFDTVYWHGRRIIAYISRHVLIILHGPRDLLQTITLDDQSELTAVAIDKITGKIAVSTASTIHIYRPYGHEYGATVQWSLVCDFVPSSNDDLIQCLSWGLPDELLIGGSALTLLATSDEPKETWTRKIASPARHAAFSHDASLIASTGQYDRLAKIWRRLFFGSDNERFDAAYLSHPAAVTALWWRGRPDEETHAAAVLYTTCADHKLRVWTDVNSHCVQILDLWHELDLLACIQPRLPDQSGQESRRYVFTINSWDMKAMIADAADNADDEDEREHHHRKHLQELAAKELEVCVVFDDLGNMSAWGLERVGHKARHANDVLNIAYAEDAHLAFASDVATFEDYMQLRGFPSPSADGSINILAHHFSGKIDWMSCRIDRLFDPTRQSQRLRLDTAWTGHSAPVKRLMLNASDPASFLILTTENEATVWRRFIGPTGTTALSAVSLLALPEPAIDGIFLHDEPLIAILSANKLTVWNVETRRAEKLCEAPVRTSSLACLFASTTGRAMTRRQLITIASSSLQIEVWIFDPTSTTNNLVRISSSRDSSRKVDQVFKSQVGGLMSQHASKASIDCWVLVTRPDEAGNIVSADLKQSKTVALGGNNEFRYIAPAGQHYVAITIESENSISIYNLDNACLEYKRTFMDHEPIKWLTWGSAADGVAVLGVVLPHKIHILLQGRVNHRQMEAPWIPIQMIDLKEATPHEADVAMWHPWSNQKCHLVVDTVSHQMFDYYSGFDLQTQDSNGKPRTTKHDMVHVAAQLNATLPIYHPTMLLELVANGLVNVTEKVLVTLEEQLKFFTDDQQLCASLGLDLQSLNEQLYLPDMSNGNANKDFSNNEMESLFASLDKIELPNISKSEQIRLRQFASSLSYVHDQRHSIDSFGRMFLLEFEFKNNRNDEKGLRASTWREIGWAQNSASQEILLDLTTRKLDSKLCWQDAKSIGMFMWMTDIEALKSRFEVVARSEYAKTEDRNPVDCALYYIALRKKTALAGLWRMATWHRERTATMKLLANNFDDQRWKSAALKNAYALLGRHRIQYAAAFFLLAGNLKDCVNVLANQHGDLQLAIAVARVYEGTETAGPVLSDLIRTRVLPQAARFGDAWLALWGYTMLGEHDMALKALTRPLADFIVVQDPPPEPKSFRFNDPSMVHMYTCLRNKRPRAAWEVSALAEKKLVMGASKTYARMGCDALSLHLLSHFVFGLRVQGATPPRIVEMEDAKEEQVKQPSMLDDFMDIDTPNSENDTKGETKAALTVNGAPRKVVKEEPSTTSILDNFDF